MTEEEARWIVDWMERAYKEADALYELAKGKNKNAAMGHSHRVSSMITAARNTAQGAIDRTKGKDKNGR
jgi:predicted dehydrogenase